MLRYKLSLRIVSCNFTQKAWRCYNANLSPVLWIFFHILSWKKNLTTILFFKATTQSFATEESMKEIEVIYTFDTMTASIANRPFE